MPETPSELPPGYTIEEGADRVTITNPWFNPLYVIAALIALGLAIRTDLRHMNRIMGANPLEGGFWYTSRVGILLLVVLVFAWFEKTVYSLDAFALVVRRGPFFWPGDRHIRRKDIDRLELVVDRREQSTYYNLIAVLKGGSRKAIVSKFASRGFPEYLQGIFDRSMARLEPADRDDDRPWRSPVRFLPYLVVPALAWSVWFMPHPWNGPDALALKELGGIVEPREGRTVVDLHHNERLRVADLDHLRGISRLDGLSLFGAGVHDAHLVHLRGLTTLRTLDLGLTPISDEGLENLEGLVGLETLTLAGCPGVGDAGLEHLRGLARLEELYLAGTQVTDEGIARLAGLGRLKVLDLRSTLATAEGVARLKRSLMRTEIRHEPRAEADPRP
jgi:hypothetical protein